MQRNPRIKDSAHLDFIRQLPCLICGNDIQTEAAHVKMADPSIAKPMTGGMKPHDMFTVPLCGEHHRAQHSTNERKWWLSKGIDPVKVALALFAESGNYERGFIICQAQIIKP